MVLVVPLECHTMEVQECTGVSVGEACKDRVQRNRINF